MLVIIAQTGDFSSRIFTTRVFGVSNHSKAVILFSLITSYDVQQFYAVVKLKDQSHKSRRTILILTNVVDNKMNKKNVKK